MIKLRIRIPEHPDSIIVVEGNELTIGRNPACDAVIPEAYVSAWHAKVVCGLAVADLGSTNGVWVDGERIEGSGALPGTRFQLGPSAEISPSIEVLEASGASAQDPAQLQALEQDNVRLKARVAELETQLASYRVSRPEADGENTLMMAGPTVESADPVEAADSNQTMLKQPDPIEPADPNQAMLKQPDPIEAEDPNQTMMKQSGPIEAVDPNQTMMKQPDPVPGPGSFDEFFKSTPVAEQASSPSPMRSRSVASNSGLGSLIEKLIREDVGDEPPIMEGPVEEFFTLESIRLLRQVEKVITRLAREFNQLYDMNTMLPDTGGNFRSFAAQILLNPSGQDERQKLVDYLDQIRRWLGVTLAANRNAARRMVVELKADLSPAGLTQEKGVPLWRQLSGTQGAEFWNRAQQALIELDDEAIEDRLDAFAKEFAIGVMEPK